MVIARPTKRRFQLAPDSDVYLKKIFLKVGVTVGVAASEVAGIPRVWKLELPR